jgi:hypothetical protein
MLADEREYLFLLSIIECGVTSHGLVSSPSRHLADSTVLVLGLFTQAPRLILVRLDRFLSIFVAILLFMTLGLTPVDKEKGRNKHYLYRYICTVRLNWNITYYTFIASRR